MTGLALEARQLTAQRVCYLCRRIVPEGGGVYHTDLGILAHEDVCSPIIDGERKTHDRSARGRARRRLEVLARVRGYWRAEAANLLRELDELEGEAT